MTGTFPLAGARRWLRALAAGILAALATAASAELPDGWNFVEYNQALKLAKQQGKPVFVYYGFNKCPYCVYVNKHTFSSEELRKTYHERYVLAYFDIRGNREDPIQLADGSQMPRGDAIKHLKASPVPAWAFLDAQGREVLARRGSRTKVNAFKQFDAYVGGGEYKKVSFEAFLASRGWVEEKVE
ncbi:MAG: thioredoxin family protein [Burkholderiales bacterium]|nr:thioredoxin family protein [Burkholderiales bacterium]